MQKEVEVKGVLASIQSWLTTKLEWTKRAAKKEAETGEATKITLNQLLQKELEKSVDNDEDAYAEALAARTPKEKHEAILGIIKGRKAALERKKKEDDEPVDPTIPPKTPREKGYLERTFDTLCVEYERTTDEVAREQLISLVTQMEVNRRVRFFYDLQKLRISAGNRKEVYSREFGVEDIFIDYADGQLGRLEKHNEKMIDRIILRSADREFYQYLRETYLGVGVLMAGCIISELSAPERFHSISAVWKYAGLAVIGNDPETGMGGHAQRRTRGELAQWNHFLRTKLLGVMADCMMKAQAPYYNGYAGKYDEGNAPSPDMIGQPKPHPKDPEKCPNVTVKMGYKNRISTINSLVPEKDRVYTKTGVEVFQYNSTAKIDWFDKEGKSVGEVAPQQIKRRSPKHIETMASRYMVKMFIVDIINEWRVLKGYAPLLTYDEAKLRGGVRHKGPDLRRL